MWLMPVVYLFIGGIEAVLAGSIVGLMSVQPMHPSVTELILLVVLV